MVCPSNPRLSPERHVSSLPSARWGLSHSQCALTDDRALTQSTTTRWCKGVVVGWKSFHQFWPFVGKSRRTSAKCCGKWKCNDVQFVVFIRRRQFDSVRHGLRLIKLVFQQSRSTDDVWGSRVLEVTETIGGEVWVIERRKLISLLGYWSKVFKSDENCDLTYLHSVSQRGRTILRNSSRAGALSVCAWGGNSCSESEERRHSRKTDGFFSRSNGVAALRIAVQTNHERERAGLKTFLRHTRNPFFVVNKETASGQREKRKKPSELNCSKVEKWFFFLKRRKTGAEPFSCLFREDRKY